MLNLTKMSSIKNETHPFRMRFKSSAFMVAGGASLSSSPITYLSDKRSILQKPIKEKAPDADETAQGSIS